MSHPEPLISIVTPVYNGEAHLVECIESVLTQTYSNWEYVVINNCSTDHTHEIVEEYCNKDRRIKLYKTEELIPAIENHNFALTKISVESQYCKILQADDILFSDCIQKMMDVAMKNPAVGIIGSYSLFGNYVRCDGIPFPVEFLSGKEVCRMALMGHAYPFLSPSSTMIRSDLVRERSPFYDVTYLHGDIVPMYELLQECDFGFVHQVLSYIRVHESSATSTLAKPLNTLIWSNFYLFVQYGPIYLTDDEFSHRLRWHLNKYYNFLADSFFGLRNKEFWQYHKSALEKTGYPLRYGRLFAALVEALFCRSRMSARSILRALGLK